MMTGKTEKLPVLAQLVSTLSMGGAENLAVQIANAHARQGGVSHMVVLTGPGPCSARLEPGVVVHYLGYHRASISNPLRFAFSLRHGLKLLTDLIREQGIQIVQTHLPDENLWGLVLQRLGRCQVVVTIHNNHFLDEKSGSALGRFMIPRLYRQIFRHCGAVVPCSEEVRNTVQEALNIPKRDQGRVFTVTNGVLRPEDLAPGQREKLRHQMGIPDGAFFLLAAGRLTEAKNFACLLDAMDLLKKDAVPVKLVIGGEGRLRPVLEEQVARLGISDMVNLPGNLENLLELMSAADGFVMSSRWEGLPLVLLESMMRGLPVVGTRIKGIADTVEDGVHGHLVDVDDAVGLARGIALLLKDREGAEAMGQRGKKMVEDRYSFARVYREYRMVYDQALR